MSVFIQCDSCDYREQLHDGVASNNVFKLRVQKHGPLDWTTKLTSHLCRTCFERVMDEIRTSLRLPVSPGGSR